MKKILLLLILIMFMSCGEKEITREDLVLKDGVTYVSKTNKKFSGELKEFYSSGKLKATEVYEQGKFIFSESFFENEKILRIYDSKKNFFKEFYSNGNIKIDAQFDTGSVQMFTENGKLRSKTSFKQANPLIIEGKFTLFFEDGSIEQEGFKKDNENVGIWSTYTHSKELKSRGIYENGVKTGLWKELENGKMYDVVYENGIVKTKNETPNEQPKDEGNLGFSMKKPEYIKNVEESKYDKENYTATVVLETMLTDEGTLKNSFYRVSLAMKYLMEKYPKAKYIAVNSEDSAGKYIMFGANSTEPSKLNLKDKNTQQEICEEVFKNSTTTMSIQDRATLKKIINSREFSNIKLKL